MIREAKGVCRRCNSENNVDYLHNSYFICPKCGYYYRVTTSQRLEMIVDKGSFKEFYIECNDINPFQFENYFGILEKARKDSGRDEALTIGEATVLGQRIALGVCDSHFMMASMGHNYGEKICKLFDEAIQLGLPVFIFCCSGGARLQEGLYSLMQMEKTAAAVRRHSDEGLFYASIITDPTTGGVTASFAMLGDVILAEPSAIIGFTGKRIIKNMIGEKLPNDFQTSEFQVKHGMIDKIVERSQLREMIRFLCVTNRKDAGYSNYEYNVKREFDVQTKIGNSYNISSIDDWERYKLVRNINRLGALDYINAIFDKFVEFKGDRLYGDDNAIIGGIALLNGHPVTVIGNEHGKNIEECCKRNFGMPNPEGYRKALRLMKQAEKFSRPIVSFVNTSGAFCGVEAEERGQGVAIANNLYELSSLEVPVLCILIGEGGSGGALATAVGNEVWIFENATFSVVSPEGYSTILWKDSGKAKEAASIMNASPSNLLRLGIVDKIVPEYGGATEQNLSKIAQYLNLEIKDFLRKCKYKTGRELALERQARFNKF